jgi:hypothetical protein
MVDPTMTIGHCPARSSATLALISFVVGSCAHAPVDARNDGTVPLEQRVALYRHLLARIPRCPANAPTSPRSASDPGDGSGTLVGELRPDVGLCEEIGDTVYRKGVETHMRCRPCLSGGSEVKLEVAHPGAADESVYLQLPVRLVRSGPSYDCDGRALATALGSDRKVTITGQFLRWSPEGMIPATMPPEVRGSGEAMSPILLFQVADICRLPGGAASP